MNLFDYASFYDTNGSTHEEREKANRQCSKQEREILSLFYEGQYVSQPSIRRAYKRKYERELAIASCSRAVSNLTELGHLEKTDVRVMGDAGKKVFTWRKINKEII